MNRDQAWKTFALGYELQISGSFLFDGLHQFHQMQDFERTEQIFGFLYNLSVGFERLFKIAIVLLEHDQQRDQRAFEQSLITHNHARLLNRIEKNADSGLHKRHREFLNILQSFYKSVRYDRFIFPKYLDWDPEKEKSLLVTFIGKHLRGQVKYIESENVTRVNVTFKKFIGKIVSQITKSVFAIITTRARKLNLYTHEIRSQSKAEKIFHRTCEFLSEDLICKELLVFLMNTQAKSSLLEFMRSIEPLELDTELVSEYIMCFFSDEKKSSLVDEFQEYYKDVDDPKERLKMMELIGNPNFIFSEDIDEYSDHNL